MRGTELCAVHESHPSSVPLSPGACGVSPVCRAQGMRTLFSQCLRRARCSTKVMGWDGQALETSVPSAAAGMSP